MAGGRLLAFFQNFGSGELVVILLVALVVVGPDRLPSLARSLGKGLHKLRTMTDGMSSQVQDIVDDPAMAPLRELGEFAARPRQKLAEYALEAEAEERFRQEQPATPAAEPGAEPTDAPTDDRPTPSGGSTTPADVPTADETSADDTSAHDTPGEPPAADVADAPAAAVEASAALDAPAPAPTAADRAETEAG